MVHLNKAEALVNWVNCMGDLNVCSLVQLVELSPFMEIVTRANSSGMESSFPFQKDTKEKLKFIQEYLQNHFPSNPCIDALEWTWSTDQGNVEMNLAKLTVAIMCCSFTSREMQHKMESLSMQTQVELRSLLQFVLENEGCTTLSSHLEDFLNHGDQVVTMNNSPSPLIPTKPLVHFKEHLHSSPAKRQSHTPPSPVWDFFRRAPLQICKLQQDLVSKSVAKDALEIELHSRTLLLQHKDEDVCRLQEHIQQLQEMAAGHPPTPPPLDQMELRGKSERLRQVMLQVRDLRKRLSFSERQADRLMVENDALATKLRYQESVLQCQRVRLRATVRSARSEYRAWQARCAALQRNLTLVTDERDCLAERLEILQNKLTSPMTSHELDISRPDATALEEVAALGVMAQLGNCGFGINGAVGWSECIPSPDILRNLGDLKRQVLGSAGESDAINSERCIKENQQLMDCASLSDDICVECPPENYFSQSGKHSDCNNCAWQGIVHGVDRHSRSTREFPAKTCALSEGEKDMAGNLTCNQGKFESFSVHSIHSGTDDDMGLAAGNENVNAGGASVDDETTLLHEDEWESVECEAEKAIVDIKSASPLDEVDKVKSIKVKSEDGVEDTKVEYESAGNKHKADIQPRDVCSGICEVDVCSAGGNVDVCSAGGNVDVCSAGGNVDVCSAGGNVDVCSAGGNVDVCSAGGNVDVCSAGGNVDVCSTGGNVDICSAGGNVDVCSARGNVDVLYLLENNALHEQKEYPEQMEVCRSEKVAQISSAHVMDEGSRVACILVQSSAEMIVEGGCRDGESDDDRKCNQAETSEVEQERVSKNSAEDVERDFWATALGTPSENGEEMPSVLQTLHQGSPNTLQKRHLCGVADVSSSKLDHSDGSIRFRHGNRQRHLGADVASWASFPLPLASSPASVQESPWLSREDWPSFTPNASLTTSSCRENGTSRHSYYTPLVSAIKSSVCHGDQWSARLPGYHSESVHCKRAKLVRATRGLQCVDEPEVLDFGQLSHSAGEGHQEKQGQAQCRLCSPNAGGTNAAIQLPSCYPESLKRIGVDSQSQAGMLRTKGILKPSNVDPEFVVKTQSRRQLSHFLRFLPSRKSRKMRGLKTK